ncbi:ParB N-terminal domain-containing protein [Desulfitobacterium sp. AusDCA]|uniref:ParB N-terminal domain-containing protein n=1 Tax=Desulfitobacterium sp. AusDCA TaxID=3240383 RepID=UPI003DA6EE75
MSKLTIGKKEYNAEERYLDQMDLKFFKDNPRVYSVLNADGAEPSQEDIQAKLITMDHVKQLKLSIKANGGLIDPLIVLDKDFIVLEGNSRLAAYRLLSEEDPLKWKTVKCTVLPSEISEDSIFTLLGQYHLIGRKDWSVFEQAGYLYRKVQTSEAPIDVIAKDLGLPLGDAKRYIRVYQFMLEHGDLRSDKWSYYDEYIKNSGIKKYRETNPDIDDTIVAQIKTGQILRAEDIRDKLGPIAKAKGKTAKKIMQNIIAEETSIYSGYDQLEETGRTNDAFQTLQRFRERIDRDEFQLKIKKSCDTGVIQLELKKIKKSIDKLLKEFEKCSF